MSSFALIRKCVGFRHPFIPSSCRSYSSSPFGGKPIYLDLQATTPVDPRVLDSMLPYFTESFGNPHSRTHEFGWEAERAVENARSQVSKLINSSDPKSIVFTSGATESNNIAVKGIARFYGKRKKHLVTVQTEHKCVLDSCRALEREGFEVTYLPVESDGIVSLKTLEESLRPDTSLVSVMYVNNEIGVMQPVTEIGKLCRSKGVFFHSDCAQALGKVPIDVQGMCIDVASLSGHKMYGPKGIGALHVGRRPRVRIESPISGGGQERGFRSGTVPAPLVVGMGAAAEISAKEIERDAKHIMALHNHALQQIQKLVPHAILNGPPCDIHDSEEPKRRWQGNLNISFAFVEGESLLMALKDVACSSGSACTSASLEPSYVLRALGVDDDLAHTSLRFGFGRFTTFQEVDYLVQRLAEEVKRLREMSPLWEMFQEGIDLKSIQWNQDV